MPKTKKKRNPTGILNLTKHCAFCDTQITTGKGGTRAREHVFKKSWILKLGHKNTEIFLRHLHKYEVQRTTRRPAIHFLAGQVCAECNNGWMNELDLKVEPYLLGMASGTIHPDSLSEDARFLIARWTLKTAAMFIFADSSDRRHIPTKTLKLIRNSDFLPERFVVFYYQFQTDQHALHAATSDSCMRLHEKVYKKFAASERLKFGIQYDRIVLGCTYVNCDDASFVGMPLLHQALYSPANNFFVEMGVSDLFNKHIDQSPFDPMFLNDFLLGITFWSEETSNQEARNVKNPAH